jgi:hypothetical protein
MEVIQTEKNIDVMTTEITSLIMKFSDSDTINMDYDDSTTLMSLIKKTIVQKYPLLNEIDTDYIPEKFLNRFKVVFKGKIIKTTNDLKIVDINDIQPNVILHCVFPPLSSADIDEIKSNMYTPLEKINEMLNSSELIELLKIPNNYKFLKTFVENKGIISEKVEKLKNDKKNVQTKKHQKKNTAIVRDNDSDLSEESDSENESNQSTELTYDSQINEIVNMGFECNDRLKQLLKEYKGDVQNVINILLG